MENNPENTFEYEPFSTKNAHPIRLLSLLPSSDFNHEIKCEIFNTSLEDNPVFEALSYTWGDAKNLIPILLHGRPHQITRNLESALRNLRLPNQTRILWVDALCINQSDIPERNQQVSKMRDIYTVGGAQKVVVWLGKIQNAQLGLEFCSKIAKEPPAFVLRLGDEVEWEACHDIFRRNAWWSRAWIVQEVVHTNKVVVYMGGSVSITFESLCKKLEVYQSRAYLRRRNRNLTDAEVQKIARPLERDWSAIVEGVRRNRENSALISNYREEVNSSPPLKQYLPGLLIRFRDQNASDFHDKVYAFQCMAFDNPSRNDIPVEYQLSKQELYTIASRTFLRGGTIPILLVESKQKPISAMSQLPSWVTDFTATQEFAPYFKIVCATKFNASRGFPVVKKEPRLLDSLNCKVLPLRGIHVATITSTFETRITNLEDFLGFDSVKLIRYSEDPQLRTRDFSKFPPTPWQTQDPETGSTLVYNTSWGPIFSQVGDILVVFAGFALPLVLRMFEEGKYLFVGACLLIEGEIENVSKLETDPGFSEIMHGRVCKGLAEDYEAEIFRIY